MFDRYLLSLVVLCLISTVGCALGPRSGSTTGPSKTLDSQLSLARLSERHGNLDFARQVYQNTLREDPQSRLAHHRIGVIEARQGRLDEAKKHFDIAMKDGKPTDELLSDYGYALYLMNDYEGAEKMLRQVTQRAPQHQAAHNNLALVLGEQGRFDESMKEFRMVVDEAEALANLAYVKSQMGEFKEAEQTYHRALAMNQEMRPAAEALIQLTDIDDMVASAPPASKPRAAPIPSAQQVAGADNGQHQPKPIAKHPPAKPLRRVGPNKDRVAAPSRGDVDAGVRAVSYVTQSGRPLESDRVSTSSRPARRSPPRSSRHREPAGPVAQSGRTVAQRQTQVAPDPLPPAFFPNAVPAKSITGAPDQTLKASKIQSVEYLSPIPRFKSSFVDDASTEFPGGNIADSLLFEGP